MTLYTTSLQGLRESNEDKHEFIENKDTCFYGLYDGHGGKAVSKYLKNNLSKYFLNNLINYNNTVELKKNIKQIFGHNQNKLKIMCKNYSYNVGSTALVGILKNENKKKKLYLYNLGDSRAVICRKNNTAYAITKDHKPNSLDESKRIGKMGGKVYFDGYDYRIGDLSVSRSFGDLDNAPYISYIPDIYKLNITSTDNFLVMACDGLWDVMSNQDVVDFILKNTSKHSINRHSNTKNNIAFLLADHAINKLKSTDNVSIIIKFFN